MLNQHGIILNIQSHHSLCPGPLLFVSLTVSWFRAFTCYIVDLAIRGSKVTQVFHTFKLESQLLTTEVSSAIFFWQVFTHSKCQSELEINTHLQSTMFMLQHVNFELLTKFKSIAPYSDIFGQFNGQYRSSSPRYGVTALVTGCIWSLQLLCKQGNNVCTCV